MNDLTIQSSPPTFPQLSEGLNWLLNSEPDAARAIETIATSPALKAEAETAIPKLRAFVTAPAGEDGVREVVGRRFALFPQPRRTDAEWAMWWADYYDVLADLPKCALEAAMQAWIREPSTDFLPKPGRLRELAKTTCVEPMQALERAKQAMLWTPPFVGPRAPLPAPILTPRGIPEPSPEDKARVKAWAAEFRRGVDANRPTQNDLPPIHGKTDETGITPELRALMASQR